MLTAAELWTRVEQTTLLGEDPDLFAGVDERQRGRAQRASVARVVRVPAGEWTADVEPSGCGLLVLEGRVLHRTRWRDRVGSELLSRGDVMQPWADDGLASLPLRCGHRAVTDVRLAVLDDDWMERVSRWPTVSVALTSRAIARVRRGAALMAVMQVRRLDLRDLAAAVAAGRPVRPRPRRRRLRRPAAHTP